MAFALAPAKESKVTALHVTQRTVGSGTQRPARRVRARQRTEKAVLDDIAVLAKRYGFDEIQTAVHTDVAPDAAILQEARRCGADLIVIGASRRVGAAVNLGQTVTSVLRQWDGGILLIVVYGQPQRPGAEHCLPPPVPSCWAAAK